MADRNKINHLIDRLDAIYIGENWLDETFEKKLGKLDSTDAFRQPIEHVHSVAEIVWHCVYWRQTLIHRLQGDQEFRDRTIDQYNFLPLEELKDMGWHRLYQELEKSQSELKSLLTLRTDDFLNEIYHEHYSYEYLIEGMLDHDAYHLGQVGLVLKMLKVQNESRK